MQQVYTTLTREKEILKPFDFAQGKKLKLFVCGITPYDLSHIGHARTYVVFDAFAKYLKQSGLKVFYLQNVTDVDDKIIKRAQELNESPLGLARRFEKEYLKDMKALKVTSVKKYARATEHIKEIVNQVERLIKQGYGYEIQGDGIYFDISKFKEYGKLSKRTSEQAQDAVSRIDESVQKRNKGDFALWKVSKPGEPAWPSPWGQGRPGWHIEDTAISEKYFGPQYDIHGGGIDLIFPHHEAEVTQMEAVSGKVPFVRYWMHTGFLTINGEKMSKSLGNFITIQEFYKKHSPRVLRLLFLKSHYRSPIDYSDILVEQTERELEKIDEFVDRLKGKNLSKVGSELNIQEFEARWKNSLDDDFNTPEALAVLFEVIKLGNGFLDQNLLSKKDTKRILEFFKRMDKILDIIFWPRFKVSIPSSVMLLMKQREEYRKSNDWSKADDARKQIEAQGWMIEDTDQGPKLQKK